MPTSGVGVGLYRAQKFGIVRKSKNVDFCHQHYYQSGGVCGCVCVGGGGSNKTGILVYMYVQPSIYCSARNNLEQYMYMHQYTNCWFGNEAMEVVWE